MPRELSSLTDVELALRIKMTRAKVNELWELLEDISGVAKRQIYDAKFREHRNAYQKLKRLNAEHRRRLRQKRELKP